jgi:hypothetical protein
MADGSCLVFADIRQKKPPLACPADAQTVHCTRAGLVAKMARFTGRYPARRQSMPLGQP